MQLSSSNEPKIVPLQDGETRLHPVIRNPNLKTTESTEKEQKNQYDRIWNNDINPEARKEIRARWNENHKKRMKNDPVYREEQLELNRKRVAKCRSKK